MYFILALGIATLAFVVERAVALYFRMKISPKGLRTQILEYISRSDMPGAERFLKSTHLDTALGRVVNVGVQIRARAGGEEELQSRMDEALTKEIDQIDRKTGFLAMFSNVATLLGLLGTISGMIQSFAAVASANPADRAVLLSKGISEAMNCTAFGLLVAIPALVLYSIFQNRTERLVSELTQSTTQIFHDLLFLTDSVAMRPETKETAKGAVLGTPGLSPA